MARHCTRRLTLAGDAPTTKRAGSLPPPAPLSYCASPRRTGGGHARHSLASPCCIASRKSVLSRVQWVVRGKSLTTTTRALPSEIEAFWLLKARATGDFLVARWSVYTALTPRVGETPCSLRPSQTCN